MGRGDIVNGTIVFGMAPSLAVIARTTVSHSSYLRVVLLLIYRPVAPACIERLESVV